MSLKIDTKEKFTAFTATESTLSANFSAKLHDLIEPCLQNDVKNVIINFKNVNSISKECAAMITTLQQQFYDNNASFVICEIVPEVEEQLESMELLELMNITPSESEAWDIVQMEEIERELLDDSDPEFIGTEEKK